MADQGQAVVACTCDPEKVKGCNWPAPELPDMCRHDRGCPIREAAVRCPPEGCCRRLLKVPPP